MRLFFFICLIAALLLSVLSLFLGGHPELGLDELSILGSILALLFVVAVMAWRGKVFKKKGRWIYDESK
jgi:hypothetical protein